MTTIFSLLGAIGGLSALIMFFVYAKQNKRIKNNEADKGEIDNLKSIIEELEEARSRDKEDRDSLRHRVEALEKKDIEREKLLIDIERNLNIHKRAINAQVECTFAESHKCPVIIKMKELNK